MKAVPYLLKYSTTVLKIRRAVSQPPPSVSLNYKSWILAYSSSFCNKQYSNNFASVETLMTGLMSSNDPHELFFLGTGIIFPTTQIITNKAMFIKDIKHETQHRNYVYYDILNSLRT